MHHHALTRSLAEGDAPPTEFRLFAAGPNPTSKGTFVFDEAAAASVMAHYAREGVELMIDLEHESLEAPIRQDSRDARGWFQLEVRNGELWAVNVRWTPDGARRLQEKTQRYVSPAFATERLEDGTERIVSILNVGLVAMPATHNAPALVAASRKRDSRLLTAALLAVTLTLLSVNDRKNTRHGNERRNRAKAAGRRRIGRSRGH